jgi:hypothetical protein
MPSMNPASRPTCPFCRVPWSDAMMDQYDRMATDNGCACCSGPAPVQASHVERRLAVPIGDLCCASCHRAIYLAPSPD